LDSTPQISREQSQLDTIDNPGKIHQVPGVGAVSSEIVSRIWRVDKASDPSHSDTIDNTLEIDQVTGLEWFPRGWIRGFCNFKFVFVVGPNKGVDGMTTRGDLLLNYGRHLGKGTES
jgi:hypothetical protein